MTLVDICYTAGFHVAAAPRARRLVSTDPTFGLDDWFVVIETVNHVASMHELPALSSVTVILV